MKRILILLGLTWFAGLSLQAQNIFHSREFWATKPSVEVVKQKIAEGNDILEMGPGGWDGPLLAIMADCDYATIKYIMDLPGIDFNVVTHHSNNYLMWTTQKGNTEVMKLLLEKGSRTDIINSHGQSLLMHAALSGKSDPLIYDLCLAHGGDLINDKDEEGKNVMLTAIPRIQDVSFLHYFTSKGLTLKDTDKHGNGLFHYAVSGGNLKTIKDLVAMGVSTAPNQLGENAFAFAGRGRGGRLSAELLNYLKSLGLNPATPFANGETLVHTVARSGADADILKFLEENKLNLSQKDKQGTTPLMLAASRGKTDFVAYWLDKNEVNAVSSEGQTALSNAVAFNSPEVVQLLLDKGADVKVKNKEGQNLYFVLVDSYRPGRGSLDRFNAILEKLQKAGLPVETNGLLLHTAFGKNDTKLMDRVLELGENINAKDKDGYTVLHYAAMKSKDLALMQYLVEKGADSSIATEFDESVTDLIAENEVLRDQQLNLDFLKR